MLTSNDRTTTDKTLLTRTQTFSATGWQVNFIKIMPISHYQNGFCKVKTFGFNWLALLFDEALEEPLPKIPLQK
ncbi:unnamed protein product [Sphenostylis stenocarpa]|uniref:Uncharacterized protein n=1 Tax=Sphenostylis stenocarpa TaxID=92480 RepID=A0AA86VDI8_9FABA|nr:unnamed protein product [Sphenostylis stenocarpa]